MSEIMNNNNSEEKYRPQEYEIFLERLKIDIADFLRCSEQGKTIRYQGLKARKKSIQLRNLLKKFREISLKHEKYISSEYEKFKKDLINNNKLNNIESEG